MGRNPVPQMRLEKVDQEVFHVRLQHEWRRWSVVQWNSQFVRALRHRRASLTLAAVQILNGNHFQVLGHEIGFVTFQFGHG